MGRYASETTVPVEKSRAEIEATVVRYGASEFQSGWRADAAMIGFKIRDLYIRFVLPLPDKKDKAITHKISRYGYETKKSELQIQKAYDQEVRQRWRALALTIKAKLEAVDCDISTIEAEFLAFITLPNQMTVGEWFMDHVAAIREGRMPLALEAPKDVQDAEIIDIRKAK